MRYFSNSCLAIVLALTLAACASSDEVSSLESALNSVEPTPDRVASQTDTTNEGVSESLTGVVDDTNATVTVETLAAAENEGAIENQVIGQETPIGDNPVMNPAGETIFKTSQVLFPKGGERIEIGKSYNIRWESEGIKALNLELHENGRKRFTVAERILAASGTYSWTPTPDLLGGSPYRQYTVVTIDADTGQVHGTSEEPFMLLGTQ